MGTSGLKVFFKMDDSPAGSGLSRKAIMEQIALAWVPTNPVVTAPIVGPTKPRHLADAVAALDITLTDEEIRLLEEHYTPRQPTGM